VILAGGAQAKNIFWQVGTSAVLGTSSVFKGTILADQAITMQTSSTMEGRALAFSAGVTFNGSGATVATAPEIAVEQPVGMDVADGGSKDFGSVLVGNTKDLIFTVINSGDADLDLTLPINFSGLDAGLFTVTVPPSSPVLPGGVTTFTVRFAPLTDGVKVAALQFANNDSDENPFDIDLTATASLVPDPEIAVEQPVGMDVADGGSKDFGTVLVGNTRDLVFTVTNSGDANLNLTLPITFSGLDAGLFSVTVPPSTPVIPGGSTTFTVNFAPLTNGAKVAALRFANNDSNENPFEIDLSGTGSGLVVGSTSFITLNPQTGLLEQTVRISNSDLATVGTVRLFVNDLPADVLIYNASGSIGGIPYLQYDFSLAHGGEIVFLIEYHRVSRVPFVTQNFDFVPVAAVVVSPPAPEGEMIEIELKRETLLSGGRVLLDFSTVPGRQYVVEYSSDLTVWQTTYPVITAPSNQTQWHDDGPPKTESKPSSVGSRFYRIIQLP